LAEAGTSRSNSESYLVLRAYHFLLSGTDATEAFEDVGHSDEARALLPDMLIGTFDKSSGVRIPTISFLIRVVAFILTLIYMQDINLFKGLKQPAGTSTTVHAAVEQGSKYVPPPSRDHSAC